MDCPEGLNVKEWEEVQSRTVALHENCRIYENIQEWNVVEQNVL